MDEFLLWLDAGRLKKDSISFFRTLAEYEKSGIDIVTSLTKIASRTKNKVLKKNISDMALDISSGHPVAVAFAKNSWVSPVSINLIRVGEETGELSKILEEIADYEESQMKLKKDINGQLRYAKIVLSVIALSSLVMGVAVVPKFKGFFKGQNVELPAATKIMFGISDFILQFWPVFLALLIFAIIFSVKAEEWFPEEYQKILLHIPLISPILKGTYLMRVSKTMALLSASGVDTAKSFEMAADASGNLHIARIFKDAVIKIRQGEGVAKAVETADSCGYIDPMIIDILSMGEDTGHLDKAFSSVAEKCADSVKIKTKNLQTSIEPITIVGMTLLVLGMFLAIYAPTFKMASELSK